MLSRFKKSPISFLAPDQRTLLEEANLPVGLIDRIAGQSVLVETYPEEPPATRRVEADDFPLLIDPNGDYWNDYRPVRVLYPECHGFIQASGSHIDGVTHAVHVLNRHLAGADGHRNNRLSASLYVRQPK